MERHVAGMEDKKGVQDCSWKPETKRPLGKPGHEWENIKIDLHETRYKAVVWIHLAWNKIRAGLSGM